MQHHTTQRFQFLEQKSFEDDIHEAEQAKKEAEDAGDPQPCREHDDGVSTEAVVAGIESTVQVLAGVSKKLERKIDFDEPGVMTSAFELLKTCKVSMQQALRLKRMLNCGIIDEKESQSESSGSNDGLTGQPFNVYARNVSYFQGIEVLVEMETLKLKEFDKLAAGKPIDPDIYRDSDDSAHHRRIVELQRFYNNFKEKLEKKSTPEEVQVVFPALEALLKQVYAKYKSLTSQSSDMENFMSAYWKTLCECL